MDFGDESLNQIIRLAANPPEDAGESLVKQVVNHALAIGYTVGHRPEVIVTVALCNCISVLRELPDSEWRDVCTRIADLLEQQAHQDAA